MSRPVTKIVDDVKRLVDNGVRELTLIGQNVNAYHGEGPDGRSWPLRRLLVHLAAIPGVARLRYSTSHPRDVDDSLIAAHRDLGELMPFVHLPVQSGSDPILAAMNRKHSAADYHDVIDRFRAARQDIAFSSDFIVGFPGKASKIFSPLSRLSHKSVTLGLIPSNIRPAGNAGGGHAGDGVGSRDGRAIGAPPDIDRQPAIRLQQGGDEHTVDVLFERPARNPGQIVGRTAYLQPAHVMASDAIVGQVLPSGSTASNVIACSVPLAT